VHGADPAWDRGRERALVPFCVLINPRLSVTAEERVEFFEDASASPGSLRSWPAPEPCAWSA
jgi:hypothetical protein